MINRLETISFSAADSFLKRRSRTYRVMANYVSAHGGYRINSRNLAFDGQWDPDRRIITIESGVTGAKMISVLAFEMTNAFQSKTHLEFDAKALSRRISKEQFVQKVETIEYQGILWHHRILTELWHVFGCLPEEMFIFSSSPNMSFGKWIPPSKEDHLNWILRSKHSDYYRHWYTRCCSRS